MELVAASKMKRAVASALSSRMYSMYSWDVLLNVKQKMREITNPLFIEKDIKNESAKFLLILITSNRGLCGAYNAQALKKAIVFLRSLPKEAEVDVVTIGKKGESAMRRIGKNIVASFSDIPDNATLVDSIPVSRFATDAFLANTYQKVFAVYTDFISPLVQKANIKQVIPVSKEGLKEFIDEVGEANRKQEVQGVEGAGEYLFEGDMNTLAGSLARKLIRMQVYQMILESNAGEQSARMVAMKNATEASGEMIDSLTLSFNKARQAGITQEISEISAGMASLN